MQDSASPGTVWWVDLKAYPVVIWARLHVNDFQEVRVLEVQGISAEFEGGDEAEAWLRSRGYRPVGEVEPAERLLLGLADDALTPPEPGSHETVLAQMRKAARIG